jgi:hypothetical protein
MSLRSKHVKLIGAAGAAALTVGALASPALAAGSASANYTCGTPLGPAHASAVYNAATAPGTMAVGQPLATSGTFTLDPATTALAMAPPLGWSKVKGTLSTKPSGSNAGLKMSFPKTTLGAGPGGSTVANATGSILAGSVVKDSFTFKLGDIGKVSLTGYKANGDKIGTVEFPNSDGTFGRCMNDAGTTTLRDGGNPVTTALVKDKTKTAASADYNAKKNIATGKAKVKSHFGLTPTGKVKFTLKKGTHKIKTISDKLNKKGKATAAFKGVKKAGKYSITAKYGGSSNMKGSDDKATFTVK